MYYRPRTPNGKLVPLVWPLVWYRAINTISWPLKDNPSRMLYIYDRCCWLLGCFMFLQHNDAEMRYIRTERNDLDKLLDGVPTYLVLIEVHLRSFARGLRKPSFKTFLKKFYADIYLEDLRHARLHKNIQRLLRPTLAISTLYMIALFSFFIVPILNVVYKRKDLLFNMIFPFDYTPMYIFVPLLVTNFYVGLIVGTTIIGEATLMAKVLLHVNARFLLLREEFMQRVDMILKNCNETNLAQEYQRCLIETLKRNAELNVFLTQIQTEFSFSIFIMFCFSAALLCTVGFIFYLKYSLGYFTWGLAKIFEMLAFGALCSELAFTTDQISSMYYESNWELVISKSSNTRENIRLMKMIVLSIEFNQKPFYLSGYDFFTVSLRSVVTILQGAASYFTALISFR